jgi:hypothetical protein
MKTKYEEIITNLRTGHHRKEMLEGRPHLVVPAVMQVEGVANGSRGPLFYSKELLAKDANSWDNKPVVVYHPEKNGKFTTAGDPIVLNTQKVGILLKTRCGECTVNGEKKVGWKTEVWLDEKRATDLMPQVVEKIKNGEMVEVSTGLYTQNQKKDGKFGEREYKAVVKSYVPDHFAILPEGQGACTVEDGAGLARNADHSKKPTKVFLRGDRYIPPIMNREFDEEQRKKAAKSGAAMKDGSFPIENEDDLKNAIKAYGRAKNKKAAKAHIIAKANAMGKGSMLPESWGPSNDSTENEMSHSKMHECLQGCLNDKYGEYRARVHDVYPNFVVYGRSAGNGDGTSTYKLFKHEYKVDKRKNENEGQVSLSGDPSEVKRHTEYRTPDGTFVGNSESGVQQGEEMTKAEIITNLITNSGGMWSEADRAFLNTKNSDWLEKATTPKEAPTANTNQTKTPQSVEEFVTNAPGPLQEILREGLASRAIERDALVKVITANSKNRIPEAHLKDETRYSTDLLRNMAALAQTQETVDKTKMVVNYSGAGGFIQQVPVQDPSVTANADASKMSKPLSTKPEKRNKSA